MTNFPTGTYVHDTDPPPQTPLVGCVRATVTVSVVCEIKGASGDYGIGDACYIEADTIDSMRKEFERCFDKHPRLSVEVEFANCKFEAEVSEPA